jgi:1,4-dihydroxy-2-naphthoyl-CoA hydrolase
MSFHYEYTIQFRDTDAAGVVYFANIISICHVGYEAALNRSGIDLKLFVNNPDVAVPITHVSADFLRPLYCGDRVIIELTPCSIDSFRFEVKYQILIEASQAAATALTKHIAIAPITRKKIELPAILTNWIEQWS